MQMPMILRLIIANSSDIGIARKLMNDVRKFRRKIKRMMTTIAPP